MRYSVLPKDTGLPECFFWHRYWFDDYQDAVSASLTYSSPLLSSQEIVEMLHEGVNRRDKALHCWLLWLVTQNPVWPLLTLEVPSLFGQCQTYGLEWMHAAITNYFDEHINRRPIPGTDAYEEFAKRSIQSTHRWNCALQNMGGSGYVWKMLQGRLSFSGRIEPEEAYCPPLPIEPMLEEMVLPNLIPFLLLGQRGDSL